MLNLVHWTVLCNNSRGFAVDKIACFPDDNGRILLQEKKMIKDIGGKEGKIHIH